MSKRGFVRGSRKPPPSVPPVRVAVAAPLALPEREPRNILGGAVYGVAGFLVLVLLFSAWQHFELLRHGYRVEQIEVMVVELKKAN